MYSYYWGIEILWGDFFNTSLNGVDLSQSSVESANFTAVDLTTTTLPRNLGSVTNALSNVDLSQSNLEGGKQKLKQRKQKLKQRKLEF